MQLRKNLNLYLSGIVVFTLTILLLSTAFALDESLGNRIAKIFGSTKLLSWQELPAYHSHGCVLSAFR